MDEVSGNSGELPREAASELSGRLGDLGRALVNATREKRGAVIKPGLEAFQPLPDLFQADESYWNFPCGQCIHRDASADHCRGCRHWIA